MAIQDVILNIISANSKNDFIIAASIFLGLIIVLKVLKLVMLQRVRYLAKKTKNEVDDLILDFIEQFEWPFLIFVAAYVGIQYLALAPEVKKVFDKILLILVAFYVTKGITKVVHHIAQREADKRANGKSGSSSLVLVMSMIIQAVIWVIAILAVISNFGFDITSLIAGLGIGGIAIAFALQKILEDIFSSFSIYFDKPFEEGDFIEIGTDSGTVKKIGLKTTRLQHLKGHELVVSNSELTNTRIHNYKKMNQRRIVFNFGVTYHTPKKKLERIPEIVSDIFNRIENASLDRVHLIKFGDFSLNYEVVYFVNKGEYIYYADIQQMINLELIDAFAREKIDFAFPTQTVYLQKG